MFTKDGIIYSDAFKYLYNARMNAVAFQFVESDGWEERELPHDFDVELTEVKNDNGDVTERRAFFCNRRFAAILPAELSYGAVKTAIIQKRYDMNSQVAIMLNKDNDEQARMYFDKMQMWRDFASLFAKKVMELV